MEDLVTELLEKYRENKDLRDPNIQEIVKKLRKKHNRVDNDLKDDEQLIGLIWEDEDLREFNLEGLTFSSNEKKANFSNVDFRGATLQNTTFKGAKLFNADFRGKKTDLKFADFSEADLTKAKFDRAILWKADFKNISSLDVGFPGAKLFSADFSHADLEGADFRGADMYKASLNNTNLRGADLRLSNLYMCTFFGSNIPDDTGVMFEYLDVRELKDDQVDRLINDFRRGRVGNKRKLDLTTINIITTLVNELRQEKDKFSKAFTIYKSLKNIHYITGYSEEGSNYHFSERRARTKNLLIRSKESEWRYSFIKKIPRFSNWCSNHIKPLITYFDRNPKLSIWISNRLKNILNTPRKLEYFSQWIFNIFIQKTCGYGEKPKNVIYTILTTIFFFGTFFWLSSFIFSTVLLEYEKIVTLSLWDYYYFSLVTFTTLGFGDLSPYNGTILFNVPIFRVVAGLEAIIGAISIAVLVVVVTKKLFR